MARLPQQNYKTKAGTSNPKDRCQTPSYALPPIIPYLNALQDKLQRQLIVWESAAGEGLLADALEVYGYNVLRSDVLTGQDYFGYEPLEYDVQDTNVPFSRKYAWMKRAYELGKPFALLAPSSLMFTKSGAALFKRYGVEILCPSDRIDFKMVNLGWDGNGAQFHSSWFTWQLNVGKFFTYVDISKPSRKRNKITGKLIQHPEQLESPRPEVKPLF